MTEHTNTLAAARLFAAWERWDLASVDSLLADDAVDRRPQSGELCGMACIRSVHVDNGHEASSASRHIATLELRLASIQKSCAHRPSRPKP